MSVENWVGRMIKSAALAIAMNVSFIGFGFAQDVTPEHKKAALTAMAATGATDRLDQILPDLAAYTKAGLIAKRPDIENEISQTVEEVAISLAARRGPLEEEVAAIYTKYFTQEELTSITEFFSSEAGIKFLTHTPILFREIDEVSKVWRQGVGRDLQVQVNEKLKEQAPQ